ncbi:MarR family transcriptional regulator [Thermoleophilia bacterium SCSIO 60948]|nr:MarR family transcriptional regulator [Thermoleophilia bacterium SCSIO 60948]
MTDTTTEPSPTVPTGDGACAYVIGDQGVEELSGTAGEAWIGLLETYKSLTRALETELEASHGLTLSSLETLGRLAAAEEGRLRLSELAAETGLSVSRMSRIVDSLGDRGLVERVRCPSDARAIHVSLTDAGLELARGAQATHLRAVQERFFDRLSEDEVASLAGIFGRFAPRAAERCLAGE